MASTTAAAVTAEATAQSIGPIEQVPAQPGQGVHGDHDQRGADRSGIDNPPGAQGPARPGTRRQHPPGPSPGRPPVPARGSPQSARDACHSRFPGSCVPAAWRSRWRSSSPRTDQQGCPRNDLGHQATGVGAGHAGAPEEQPGPPCTRPARACENSADRLVTPTTSSDVAIACGRPCLRHERSGTVRIEPPPPSKPSADADEDGQADCQSDHVGSSPLSRSAEADADDGLGVARGASVVGQLRQRRFPSRRYWSATRKPVRHRSRRRPIRTRARQCWPAAKSRIKPATRRTWRARSQRCAPRLTAKPLASQAVMPPARMCTLLRSASRRVSSALVGALPGAADQYDVFVEMLDDLVAVFPQQVQRHVVGPGDVCALESPGVRTSALGVGWSNRAGRGGAGIDRGGWGHFGVLSGRGRAGLLIPGGMCTSKSLNPGGKRKWEYKYPLGYLTYP